MKKENEYRQPVRRTSRPAENREPVPCQSGRPRSAEFRPRAPQATPPRRTTRPAAGRARYGIPSMQNMALYLVVLAVLVGVLVAVVYHSFAGGTSKTTEVPSGVSEESRTSDWEESHTPISSAVSSAESSGPSKDELAVFLETHPDHNTETLLRLLENNPDAYDFVAGYPEKCGTQLNCTLTEEDLQVENGRLLPLFLQWDDRWGYTDYGGYLFGTNACGPTTLSMVAVGLTGDTSLTPRTVADFAEANYFVAAGGNGSEWSLMSRGGRMLGLQVEELSLDEDWIRWEVQQGHPVVCIMGPGHFTTGGHFIVICGVQGDQFWINDCNSPTRSARLWGFDEIQDEIRNLWAFSYDD